MTDNSGPPTPPDDAVPAIVNPGEVISLGMRRARDALDAAPIPSPPISLGAARAQKAQDNRLWTPVECLQDILNDIQSGAVKCDRVLVLRVTIVSDDGSDVFDVGYNCAGLKGSEILSVLEVAKAMILHDMGYP